MTQPIYDKMPKIRFFRPTSFDKNGLRSFFQYLQSEGYDNKDLNKNIPNLEADSIDLKNINSQISVSKTVETGWHILDCRIDNRMDLSLILKMLLTGARQLFAEFASVETEYSKFNTPQFLWLSNRASVSQFTPWIENTLPLKQWDGSTLYCPLNNNQVNFPNATDIKDISAVPVFKILNPVQKAEVLRWLLHENKTANDRIIEVLTAALKDEHWEVNITAMLIAARFNISSLLTVIRNMPVPLISRSGLNREERSIVGGMKQAAIALLNGEPVPGKFAGNLQTREEKWTHLLQCVSGKKIQVFENCYLLSIALTDPVLPYDIPDCPLVKKLTVSSNKFFLPHSGIEMIFIPPGKYWLGNEWGIDARDNKIRNSYNDNGFFISKYPLLDSDMLADHDDEISYTEHETYLQKSFNSTMDLCREMSIREDIDINLPTAEEWEMAARGKNGLLYPWGCSYFEGMEKEGSVYQVMAMSGIVPQWVLDGRDNVLMGGVTRSLRCYEKDRAINEQTLGAIRLVARL